METPPFFYVWEDDLLEYTGTLKKILAEQEPKKTPNNTCLCWLCNLCLEAGGYLFLSNPECGTGGKYLQHFYYLVGDNAVMEVMRWVSSKPSVWCWLDLGAGSMESFCFLLLTPTRRYGLTPSDSQIMVPRTIINCWHQMEQYCSQEQSQGSLSGEQSGCDRREDEALTESGTEPKVIAWRAVRMWQARWWDGSIVRNLAKDHHQEIGQDATGERMRLERSQEQSQRSSPGEKSGCDRPDDEMGAYLGT